MVREIWYTSIINYAVTFEVQNTHSQGCYQWENLTDSDILKLFPSFTTNSEYKLDSTLLLLTARTWKTATSSKYGLRDNR